ncbi:MAG: threonine--tRNA ligase [Rhodocyclales bacterium CG17_big_fil_post_rev_8_21_14_2_50_68_7]|nr:MAG: threonine--tRNA ligase [Betaproteobacteria bacterium CG2_30_68_42]PIV75407.1 MAG: threonine--tRNA ligase [Rhodocyclales bacterium CG17_big_fil_post_rev_8_21_14_2_50_68_7]PIX75205.1 MAG: threonine--tRNA ligase [Rhodocyclales bacterium CG_4_10_14_3_um_filter_68_10]PJA56264.1 MAG: threonine--tRNA ligase [Rhodocyclales bacterium CG_4_9_14_3_um_filter_68_10]
MPVITLPDGTKKEFASPVTVAEAAASIGAGLARAALAGRLDGKLVDTSCRIEADAALAIVTERDPEGVAVLRHSTAHLLAHAVKELFPDAQVTIGPVIENGFYYDFSCSRAFTPEDLARIEARMHELAKKDFPVTREVWERARAIAFFRSIGERYKAELIEAIPEGQEISLYRQGEFIDLCRGPHVPSTGRLRVFKLMKVAGAYWRGDSRNEMLQRIYGTAWARKDDLDAHLHRLEEAEKRDHRKLGRSLDLFHLQDEAPGMVFWHPHGWTVWQQIEQYMRRVLSAHGYLEVRTPQVMDRLLWERSGHWENYAEHMFTTASENRDYAVKPMNCPGHVQIFNQGVRSYRDLPLRLAEFGSCHRNEPSGALHGLMRVRGFVQDDAHIFCTEAQVLGESLAFIDLLREVYADFGFSDLLVKLSTRPAKRIGSDAVWDRAEAALAEALDAKRLGYEVQAGEGAFYGPKIEFSLRDCLNRVWQCGTLQIDFSLPQRLGAEYVGEDNARHTPVMLHRAVLGSLERFIGILIEHHAGAFPLWLAPVQAAVLNISALQAGYAASVAERLRGEGLRAVADLRNEKITYKIREHSVMKLPYLIVVGEKEKAAATVAVRARGGRDLGQMSIDALVAHLKQERDTRAETAR